MKILIILNDPPYGSERSYNGLRLATSLAKSEGVPLKESFRSRQRCRCSAWR